MGWKDAFKSGNTAGVNFNHMAGASAASSFGDAFKDIGKTIIAADAQAGKDKLLALQLQNEQIKLDEAATKRADTNTQEYAASMTRDAWGKDKLSSLDALDTSASHEATLNATQAIESFYAPTKEMKQEWTAQEKVVQDANNKAYLADAFTLDSSASKEARQNAADALQQFYKPETAQLTEIEKRFKTQDDLAQTNFNNELREQATNFDKFADFQKSPNYKTLLTNADAPTVEHIIDRFKLSDKDAAALRKTNAEIKHYENADANARAQTQIDRDKLKETKRQHDNPNPTASTLSERKFEYQQERDDFKDGIREKQDRQKNADETFKSIDGFKSLPKKDQMFFKKEYVESGYIPTSTVDDSGLFNNKYIFSMPESSKQTSQKSTQKPTGKVTAKADANAKLEADAKRYLMGKE